MSRSFRPAVAALPLPAALAAALALSPTTTTAQEAPPAQNIVITATRTPQRVDQALADVTVIDRAQIEAATGRTLPELLAREAGVQIWANGGLGKTSAVSLRGLESRHTMLLVDGVRYGSATIGTPIWDNLPLDAIERIEIVRGPLSGLYGSDAVGGVVQVFTRGGVQRGVKADASATVGSGSFGEAAAGLRFGASAVDGALRVQHLRSSGFSATNASVPFGSFNADDDGFRQNSASARLGATLGSWRAEASLLASRGLSRYDDGPGADARTRLTSEVASVSARGPVAANWRIAVRAARSKDASDTQATASAFTPLGATTTVQDQTSVESSFSTPLGTVLALVERVQQAVARPGQPYAVQRRIINGVALGLDGSRGVHGWQANVRRDRNSQFGQQSSGAVGYGIEVAPGVRLAASAGNSFVAPSFNQLYFPNFGNPNLLPEEGQHRELSLRWQHGSVTTRIAAFDNRIRGFITSGPNPANLRARISGASASVDAALGAWALSASLDSVEPINDITGRQLPRRVADSARMALDWSGGAGFSTGASINAHGPRFDNTNNTLQLGGYALLDLRASWQLAKGLALGVKLNNSLGKRYETVQGYNQPGREGFVTLRWEGV